MNQLATSQNGNGATPAQTEIPPMRERHRKAFELATRAKLRQAEIENEGLRNHNAALEARALRNQIERDEAVSECAKLKTCLLTIGNTVVQSGARSADEA